ncbi:hypothetical protein [Mangrovivirga cuniculi]|uniref:DUF3052 domain-containing protein n=1 Tax=Mangrovivirga cuniculi TaxID=2715131 RepID=A0A4D7JLY9_9BACT|nr:hypothetical protein [Mangrovivirga cuniculi]QCK16859.1 hypothetical protein DCC35_20040 [Mangrovivirga cuniculi]
MDSVFKKMNLKDHNEVFVIDAPESFNANIQRLPSKIKVYRNIDNAEEIEFIVIFVTLKEQIDASFSQIKSRLAGDALVWYCYPKGSSKKYKCDFNRDNGWQVLGDAGLEPVRMVAIDEDWSALRFRKVEYVKKMTRRKSMAMSKEGKIKTKGGVNKNLKK